MMQEYDPSLYFKILFKARRVEVNQGLDLDLRLENLVITGACLSSRKDRVHIKKSGESQVKEDWL